MSVEIYGNFNPKIAQHIDARLKSVASVSALPDPTIPANFLYEGALAYVAGSIKKYYKCVQNITSTGLEWKPFDPTTLGIGTVNITPGTTVLDLNSVSPSITDCYAVVINIVGGSSATLQAITNFPGSDKLITFYTSVGQQITFKHTNYDVATTDQIVLEVGFDMTIKGRTIGNESLTLKRHGIANCQWDATQFMKSTEWIQNLLSMTVVDNLTTTNTSLPLSANQGYILNNLLANKQQILSSGNSIQLTAGPSSTLIEVIPKDWVNTIIPASPSVSVATATFIASNMPAGTTNYYRYVDLRLLSYNSGGNRGFWLLPPGKNPQSSANWINIEAGKPSVWSGQWKYTNDTNLLTSVVANKYYPRIDTTSFVGSAVVNTNTDGSPTQKVSIQFPELRSTFKVDFSIILIMGDAVQRSFKAEFYTTNGLQFASNPINTGTLRRIVPHAQGMPPASNTQLIITGSYLVTTGPASNSNDTFTIALTEAANNFANITLSNNSLLNITKIS